jgi:carbonic anhydrase
MTCPNATAPVNIVNNPEFICDLKCEYSFKYPLTSLNVANRGDYLSLKTDPANSPPVTFNANKYDVTEMRLYQPSLHTYSGKSAAAELIIVHSGVSSQGNLLVCVPIVLGSISASNPDSSSILDLIISEVAKTANSAGSKTSVNIPTFTIDKMVPMKPYFSYSGTLPYSPCSGDYDYIVYSQDSGAFLSITDQAYTALQQVISANSYTQHKNKAGVFYNKNGPTNAATAGGNDIYMECLPTGSEGEALVPLTKNSSELFHTESIKTFFKNNKWLVTFLEILLGLLIIFVLLKGGQYIFAKRTVPVVAEQGGGSATLQAGTTLHTGGLYKRLYKKRH